MLARKSYASHAQPAFDLVKFAGWVHQLRSKKRMSLEALAREVTFAGYPISQNKLFRLEQNLKPPSERKRPLQVLDYELKVRLEDVLGESFTDASYPEDVSRELISVESVRSLIQQVADEGARSSVPKSPALAQIRRDLLELLSKK